MSNIHVIPDIHESNEALDYLDRVISSTKFDTAVLLGDLFFGFRERQSISEEVEYLREFVHRLNKIKEVKSGIILRGNWEDYVLDFDDLDNYTNTLKQFMEKWQYNAMIDGVKLFKEIITNHSDLREKVTKIILESGYIHEIHIGGKKIIFAHSILDIDYESTIKAFKRHRQLGVKYTKTKHVSLNKENGRRSSHTELVLPIPSGISLEELEGTIIEGMEYGNGEDYIFFFGHSHVPTCCRDFDKIENGVIPIKEVGTSDVIDISNFRGLVNPGTLGGVLDSRAENKRSLVTIDTSKAIIELTSEL